MAETLQSDSQDRRLFLKKACSLGLGTAAILAPIATSVAVLLDPLRRKSAGSEFVLITNLSALPENGTPQKFSVITTHEDAWNRTANVPVGAIYLRRTGPQSVQALNVVCPHLGCAVDLLPSGESYLCPCHNSTFALNGKINDPHSPAPRGLDELPVEIRNGAEIWVKFQNFLPGTAAKIPA
jgi:menaquinol-cytochrome c reductase iron-sulfur subunit